MVGSRFEARPILRVRSPVIGRGEQVFELGTEPVTIGRADDCDIVLLEQSASRIHARVLPLPEGWQVVDEDSHGGVWIHGERVRAHRLHDGETFKIGDSEIQYVVRPAAQPTVIGSTPLPRPAPAPPAPAPPPPAAAPPVAAAPRVAAPRVVPVASAPSFVDFGPVGRPPMPEGSGPSFVDFGPVGQPAPQGSAPSFVDFGTVGNPGPVRPPSFTGELADDASRMERREKSGSKFGTWFLLALVFLGLSVGVAVMAFGITWDDVLALFDR